MIVQNSKESQDEPTDGIGGMLAIRQYSILIWHGLVPHVGTECFKERKGLIDRAAVCTQCGAKVSPDVQEGVFRRRDWPRCA
jgi:hypothetical protein